MKKKKTTRKLQLNRMTLLNLDPARHLDKVQGGYLTEYPCESGWETFCPRDYTAKDCA